MPRPAPRKKNQESSLTKKFSMAIGTEEAVRKHEAFLNADPLTIPGSVKVTPSTDLMPWQIAWKSNR